jgi:hypothetical protein
MADYDSDGDMDLGCIGSMFDTAHGRSTVSVSLPLPPGLLGQPGGALSLQLRCIDAEPGHVQSGQYIWPAAEAASRYICAHWPALASHTVIELGAGCGMAGIAAAKMGGSATSVIFTDHDPGSCRLLEENAVLNGIEAQSKTMQQVGGVIIILHSIFFLILSRE